MQTRVITPLLVFIAGATFSYNSANLRQLSPSVNLLRVEELQFSSFSNALSSAFDVSVDSGSSTGSFTRPSRTAGSNTMGSRHEELVRLTRPHEEVTCPSPLVPVQLISNATADNEPYRQRKIPRIIHLTGKTKCLSQAFNNAAQKWSAFPNFSFYFHDDAAVDALIHGRDWPEFPQLQNTMRCLRNAGGAAMADIWRYLVLYEFGGIYSDMDNYPGVNLENGTAFTPDLDAFFIQEGGGFLSQYFFATSPKHPLMFQAVQDVMNTVHHLEDTGNFYGEKY